MKILSFVLLSAVFSMISGCKNTVVRDAAVYGAELDFIDAVAVEQVERGKALIEGQCKCVEISGVKAFVTSECHEMAETVLLIEARLGYHTDMMRFLGGLIDERPPMEAPAVPDASKLCPVSNQVPVQDETEHDPEPIGDAGVV